MAGEAVFREPRALFRFGAKAALQGAFWKRSSWTNGGVDLFDPFAQPWQPPQSLSETAGFKLRRMRRATRQAAINTQPTTIQSCSSSGMIGQHRLSREHLSG